MCNWKFSSSSDDELKRENVQKRFDCTLFRRFIVLRRIKVFENIEHLNFPIGPVRRNDFWGASSSEFDSVHAKKVLKRIFSVRGIDSTAVEFRSNLHCWHTCSCEHSVNTQTTGNFKLKNRFSTNRITWCSVQITVELGIDLRFRPGYCSRMRRYLSRRIFLTQKV